MTRCQVSRLTLTWHDVWQILTPAPYLPIIFGIPQTLILMRINGGFFYVNGGSITITYGSILDTSSTGASFLIATILTTPLTLATWRRRRILMTPPHLPSTSAWESLVKCWAEMKTDTPASIASQRFQSQVWSRAVSTSARYAGEAQTLRWVLWLFNV